MLLRLAPAGPAQQVVAIMSLLAHHRITAAASQQMKSIRCPLSSYNHRLLRRSISSSPPLQKLAHEWISNGNIGSSSPSPHDDQDNKQQTIVFLHGLLGNAKNLRTPAKKFRCTCVLSRARQAELYINSDILYLATKKST